MWVQVQLLRRKGARLAELELEPPVVGELTIAFENSTRPGRPQIRVANLRAELTGTMGMRQTRLLPLFDARLVELQSNVLRLTGVELSSDAEMRVSEHVQVWRCRLIAAPNGGSAAGP